jgi:hypothetical protein
MYIVTYKWIRIIKVPNADVKISATWWKRIKNQLLYAVLI